MLIALKTMMWSLGIGPAGTGKTFLAVTLAVTALKRGQVKRIVLTRPAVEAGESLGFCLVISRKRWIRTFALFMMPFIKFSVRSRRPALWNVKLLRLHPSLICVVVPSRMPLLSFDEAQNTTIMQMKMFLTRLGFNSKMIVNGDMSQIDFATSC